MGNLTFKEKRDITWAHKMEKLAPVISFAPVGDRSFTYLLQTLFVALGTVTLSSLVFSHLVITIASVLSSTLLLALIVGTVGDDDLSTDRKHMRDKLRQAAEDAFDNGGEIELADYIQPRTRGRDAYYPRKTRDDDFLNTLTSRQIRWIQRKYKKEEKNVLRQRTHDAEVIETDINDTVKALNGTVDTANIKQVSYRLDAMKELKAETEKRENQLTEADKMEEEFKTL